MDEQFMQQVDRVGVDMRAAFPRLREFAPARNAWVACSTRTSRCVDMAPRIPVR